MAKQPRENPKHMTKIGGQALIEGVMMKGADTGAMACRLPNGEIDVETWKENNGKNMPWYRKCPFVRGSFNFVLSMKDGYRCLTKSAEKQVPEDEEESDEDMNRFEKWLDEKLGDKLFGIIMSIGMVIGIAVAIGLFVFLHHRMTSTQLFCLERRAVAAAQIQLHILRLIAGDHTDPAQTCTLTGADDPSQHGNVQYLEHGLRDGCLHTIAVSAGKNNNLIHFRILL